MLDIITPSDDAIRVASLGTHAAHEDADAEGAVFHHISGSSIHAPTQVSLGLAWGDVPPACNREPVTYDLATASSLPSIPSSSPVINSTTRRYARDHLTGIQTIDLLHACLFSAIHRPLNTALAVIYDDHDAILGCTFPTAYDREKAVLEQFDVARTRMI